MLDKPLGLVVLLVQSLLAGRRARARSRPKDVRPRLECLEERYLLDAYTWTGANNKVDLNWSDKGNWAVDGALATRPPGVMDDVTLDDTGFAGSVWDSVVDAGPDFGGTVHGLTIAATYADHTLSLNRALSVTRLEIDGGTVGGNSDLTVTDHPFGDEQPTFIWTGGTLGGGASSWVHLSSDTSTSIIGRAIKTLDGRNIDNNGVVGWSGAGNIALQNTAQFQNQSGSTFGARDLDPKQACPPRL